MDKRKLRIGIASPSGVLGGAEQLLLMIARFLYSQGHEVDLFFLTNKSTETWTQAIPGENHNLPNAKKERTGLVKLSWLILKNKVYKREYDIFITSHPHLTGYIGFLRKLGILKINKHVGREAISVFKEYSGKKLWEFNLYYSIGYSKLDLLICQTELMKADLIKWKPWLGKVINIQAIPNPVNSEEIQQKLKEPGILPEVLKDKKYIVSAGRFIPRKGFDILIDAYKKLLSDYPEMYLVILGDGYLRDALEEQIRKLALENRVFLVGWTNNVFPFFKHAELCVISSSLEGFPNVLLQMMASNDRVVSTLCAGGIDQIEGIYTCESSNIEELYLTMKRALSIPSSANRQLLDQYLHDNSIENYINTIKKYIE